MAVLSVNKKPAPVADVATRRHPHQKLVVTVKISAHMSNDSRVRHQETSTGHGRPGPTPLTLQPSSCSHSREYSRKRCSSSAPRTSNATIPPRLKKYGLQAFPQPRVAASPPPPSASSSYSSSSQSPSGQSRSSPSLARQSLPYTGHQKFHESSWWRDCSFHFASLSRNRRPPRPDLRHDKHVHSGEGASFVCEWGQRRRRSTTA